MTDHKALIAEARTPVYSMALRGRTPAEGDDLVRRLADALEAATVERAVVEAQALEQFAENLDEWPTFEWDRPGELLEEVAEQLRKRAVEIREGRQ